MIGSCHVKRTKTFIFIIINPDFLQMQATAAKFDFTMMLLLERHRLQ